MVRPAAWALGALLVLGACSGDDAPTVSSSTSTTSTTFDRRAEEQAVIAAYLAEVEDFLTAANPPDPDHPGLHVHATGRQLQDARDVLRTLKADGLAIVRSDKSAHRPTVTRLAPNAAVVEDCVTDADVKVRVASGEVVDDKVVVGEYTARLVKHGGAWLVENSTFTEAPCAE